MPAAVMAIEAHTLLPNIYRQARLSLVSPRW